MTEPPALMRSAFILTARSAHQCARGRRRERLQGHRPPRNEFGLARDRPHPSRRLSRASAATVQIMRGRGLCARISARLRRWSRWASAARQCRSTGSGPPWPCRPGLRIASKRSSAQHQAQARCAARAAGAEIVEIAPVKSSTRRQHAGRLETGPGRRRVMTAALRCKCPDFHGLHGRRARRPVPPSSWPRRRVCFACPARVIEPSSEFLRAILIRLAHRIVGMRGVDVRARRRRRRWRRLRPRRAGASLRVVMSSISASTSWPRSDRAAVLQGFSSRTGGARDNRSADSARRCGMGFAARRSRRAELAWWSSWRCYRCSDRRYSSPVKPRLLRLPLAVFVVVTVAAQVPALPTHRARLPSDIARLLPGTESLARARAVVLGRGSEVDASVVDHSTSSRSSRVLRRLRRRSREALGADEAANALRPPAAGSCA